MPDCSRLQGRSDTAPPTALRSRRCHGWRNHLPATALSAAQPVGQLRTTAA